MPRPSSRRRAKANPFTRVFTRAVNFFAEMKPGALREASAAPLRGSQVEALRLVLDAESAAERDQLSSFIPWLATIGSVSPLIGLLGTVLGVIDAFIGIAAKGSGNIERGRAGRGRGADRDGGGARGRDSGGVRVQHLRRPAQPARE